MPSLSPKDRAPLCLFTYEDHRRCRTPRKNSHPHFCFYHAQKESQSQSTEKLAKDLTYFFSGDYLSANDLNAALGRLIPAVIRGELKPRVARTVAYMLQTLMQSSRQAQHEYINAFSTGAWRDAISNSVNSNHKYLHPPKPKQPTPSPTTPATVGAGLVYTETRSARPAAPAAPPDCSAQPVSSPGSKGATSSPPQPPPPTTPQPTSATPPTPPPTRPSPADTEAALKVARSLFPDRAHTPESQPNSTPPPTPPPQSPTPPRDPSEIRIPHNSLRVDGKRW